MGGQTYSSNQGTNVDDAWERRINRTFWLFEQQSAIDHFYKRAGQMLVDLIVDEPELEKAIEEFLIDNGSMMELELIFESINAIKDIRKELSRRHKGLTH